MIPDIKELNFPKINGKQYATLTHAEVDMADMGEKTITTKVKIDHDVKPDFSQDWAVVFQGEKYIMPLRKPQGSVGDTPFNTDIDLTFQHWAIYQLKRFYFCTIAEIEPGTVNPDKFIATVILNLGDFCALFSQVLGYYYKGAITIDLNPAWSYDKEPQKIDISYSKIWDVLAKLFEIFGVRWTIEPNGSTENYVIKVGYSVSSVDHIFRYGFEGGLLKIERQVQNSDISNLIIGRGSSENLPRYYFKRVPESEKGNYHEDPDWIPELANIPFEALRGATFRSYVQGWKTRHWAIEAYRREALGIAEGEAVPANDYSAPRSGAYAKWAWDKGYTDEKFDPIEFVGDTIADSSGENTVKVEVTPGYEADIEKGSSIDRYGPIFNSYDNEDVKPTLQGTGLDIAVDVEQITADSTESDTPPDVTIAVLDPAKVSVTLGKNERKRVTTTPRKSFTVEHTANLLVDAVTAEDSAVTVEQYNVKVYNAAGETVSASGIPAGRYSYEIEIDVYNTTATNKTTNVGATYVRLQDAVLANRPGGTFDIWVKNIWASSKKSGESDTAYAERIWKPILGDKEGNSANVMFTTGALALSDDYEFTIVEYPAYDTSKTYTDSEGVAHTSHWRIKLAKSDADLESLGKYVPNKERNGAAGDHFVFTGIEMTFVPYVTETEKRLDNSKKDQFSQVSDVKPTYVVSTNRVRLGEEGKPDALIRQIKVGIPVTLSDERLIGGSEVENLYITALKYTYREPTSDDAALNPDLEMTLSNDYATSINPLSALQGEVSALAKQMGSLSNVAQAVSAVGDKRYLRKDSSDRTPYNLTVGKDLTVGKYNPGVSGAVVKGDGNSELLNLILRGFLSSAKFADGFAGEGWRIWLEDGLAHLTVDELTVRKAMTVFELLIEKIRAVGGQICVSAANGKIKTVEEDEEYYYINFENANEFISYDLIRCQTFTQGHLKSYWVAVEDSDAADGVSIAKSEFEGQSAPAVGDDCVLMGNTKYANRQNLILISATEDGQPRVDVLDGVKSKSFAGCLRARLGALDGITDAAFGDDQPQGHGLYSDNVYLRGRFVLTSGEEILTRFAITEGKITSAVDSLRGDVDIPENFITNPMLADGTKGWDKLSAVGGGTVMPATVIRDSEDRPVLSLNNGGVTQTRASMKGEPEYYPTNESGLKEPVTVYLSFLCKSSTGGRISAGLYRTSRSGFVKQYTTLSVEEQLPVSNDYQLITASGLWNGEGALWIEMAGEVKVYKVTLSVDKLAARYRTLFEQSDKLIKLSAENFNDDGSVKSGSYIEQTAEEISAGVEENIDGNLRRTGIDITSGEIDLISDKVRFVDSQGNEQVFISNGIINSKAIETDSLTAGKLEMYEREADGTRAANPTVRITPESKGMHILDKSSGEIRQEFSGKEYAAKDAIFGSGGSGNIDLLSASGGYTFNATDSAPAGSDSEVEIELSSLYYTNSSASVKITAGKIQAYAKTADKTLTTDPSTIAPTVWSKAESTVSIVLRQYDSPTGSKQLLNEWVIATASATAQSRRETPLEDSGSGSSSSTYTYKGKEATDTVDCTGVSALTQGAGYLKLFLVYRAKATKNGGTASVRYGNSIINNPALAAYYATEVYVARYFGNGFCLGRKADDYVLAMYGTDGMRFEARNGNSGLRMTPSGGVQTLVSGSGSSEFWASVPRLLCRCTYTWNSSANSYTASTTSGSAVSFDGSYPTATRTNEGRVTLVLPSAWTSVFGSLAIRDNLHVAIYGRGAVTGSVINQNQSQLFLQLRNATAAADGSFRIDISLA